MNWLVLAILLLAGILLVVLSFLSFIPLSFMFKLSGGVSIALSVVGTGLYYIKISNQEISNFICGVLAVLMWIIVIVPYAIVLPIVVLFIP